MRITKRQLRRIIREMTIAPGGGDPTAELASAVQELVDDGKGLFDFKKMLEAMGYQDVQVTTSPISMVMVRAGGRKYAIVSSNAADPGPNDQIVGNYVVGVME